MSAFITALDSLRRSTLAAVVLLWPCLCASAAAERVDHPPVARLKDQELVAGPGERGVPGRVVLVASIVRGYEAIYFSIEPEDSGRGSRWAVYDTGQEKVTTLHGDLNKLCGEPAEAGKLGQRVYAARRGPDTLLGTGPAPGKGQYPGGHVLRNGKDLGVIEPGWAVVAFDPVWANRWRKDKTRRGRHELGYLALARSPYGKRFRIYHVDTDKTESLGIEGGPELKGFYGRGDHVVFPAPDGALMQKSVNADEPPTPARGKPPKPAERAPAAPEGVKPAQSAYWAMRGSWLRAFEKVGRMDLIRRAHLQGGYSCFARDGADAGAAAELFIHRPPAGKARKLCSLAPFKGRTLHRVHHVRFLPSQDVAVLAGNDGVTVLQVYEAPLLNTICAQWNALMEHALRGEPVVKARHVGNLYDFSKYADRGMDPMLVASDGRPYFGTMPHHSSESGQVFSFDPAAGKLLMLGYLDRLAGVKKPGVAPHMIHASAFEMNGKVYFVGQDSHYGGHGFPLAEGKEQPRYQGSPIVEYDIKTRQCRGLGTPLPPDRGIFAITGDPKRKVLYVRRGYSHGVHGPFTWFALQLDARGNITGEPKPLPFEVHPSQIIVGADGRVIAAAPDAAFKTYLERRRARQKTDDLKPRCGILRYDPDTGKAEVMRTVEGVWEIWWLPWQNGRSSVIGRVGGHAHRLDVVYETFALKKLWPWPREIGGHPSAIAIHGGRIYWIARVYRKELPGVGRTAGFHSVDIASGKVLFHGLVVDEAGRRPKDLNYFGFLPDGRIFAAGTVFGLPTDRHYMRRYRDSEPFRLDCAAFVIDKLPPGVPPED